VNPPTIRSLSEQQKAINQGTGCSFKTALRSWDAAMAAQALHPPELSEAISIP